MWNKKLLTFLRYYTLLLIIAGIILKNENINSVMIIFIFIFIINNQLRFFSLEKNYQKIISFGIELIFITISYKWIGGYLIIYLILSAIDSNILFDRFMQSFFNIVIAFIGVYLSYNESLEFKFVTLGILGVIIAILYFIKDENDKKLQAQELYDKLRISEEKLVKANRDLEVYASSIEELTLLRERNRISREIHDSVGHALSAIVIQLGAIERTLGKSPEVTKELTRELKKFAQNSLKDIRSAVREIKPKEFEEFEGILIIEELINSFKKLTGMDVRLAFTKEKWPLNSDQAFVIYRIIQEFLANSLRHGKATSIQIFMAFTEYKLVVTLKDNGVGAKGLVEGMGLKSMRERVTEIGGIFEYNTKLEQGFLVKLELDKKEKLKIHSQGDNNGENKDHIS
ncbi:sensor histidine kinase [Desnuesiella massiliensis]|uniref:sensor histidine kinase n=1 Tax=Desnuesiella massiliensis TaxID=1650662 RepID=UPI0006E2BA40|nr:sensor histidine kinase [Desnuesiella massiliensis]